MPADGMLLTIMISGFPYGWGVLGREVAEIPEHLQGLG